jgi:glutamate decarboxylase
MNIIGQQGYQLLIERSIALAKTFAELIEQHEDFEIITAPQLNILTYRFCPKPFKQNASLETLNELNTQLQKRQREQGKSFVSRTRFRHPEPSGQTHSVLRAVLANPLTKEEHLKAVLTEQSEIGHQWIQEQSS